MSKLKLMGKNHSDELYTPEYAFEYLAKYIPKDKKVLECSVGTGKLKKHIESKGIKTIGSTDFFNEKRKDYDIIISNPPYSKKDEFLEECYRIGKPFALLLPINAFEGKRRHKLYRKYGIQVLLPNKRIDFNGKKSPWFYTAWFCWRILPRDIMFTDEQEAGL